MTAKSQSVWAKYLKAPERPYLPLLKIVMNYWVMVISKMSILENTGFWYFFVESADFFDTSTFDILQAVTSKPINHTIF